MLTAFQRDRIAADGTHVLCSTDTELGIRIRQRPRIRIRLQTLLTAGDTALRAQPAIHHAMHSQTPRHRQLCFCMAEGFDIAVVIFRPDQNESLAFATERVQSSKTSCSANNGTTSWRRDLQIRRRTGRQQAAVQITVALSFAALISQWIRHRYESHTTGHDLNDAGVDFQQSRAVSPACHKSHYHAPRR
jgi:hypothetical protein